MLIINDQEHLNFSTDESTNIRKERVLNLCVNVLKLGAFYLLSEALGSEKADSEILANWLLDKCLEFSKNDPKRISSFASDTCSTQRKVATSLTHFKSELSHVFWAPCDSHGLQLIIRDVVLKIPVFYKAMEVASSVANAFSHSNRAIALLREKTKNPNLSFAISVITRWGTQLRLLNSILSHKYAIQEFFEEPRDDASPTFLSLKADVVNPQIWKNFNILRAIFEPIDHAIKASESDQSTLMYVISRWKKIYNRIIKACNEEEANSLLPLIQQQLRPRFLKQITKVHVLAYMLDPANIKDATIPFWTKPQIGSVCNDYLMGYCPKNDKNESTHGLAIKQLYDFRAKEGGFAISPWVWEHENDPITFWNYAAAIAPELGAVAKRIVRIPATSVPSERAFSIMNLLHNKTRNRLKNDRVNKLQFVYINQRVLERYREKNWIPLLELEEPELLLECNDGPIYDPSDFIDIEEGFDQIIEYIFT